MKWNHVKALIAGRPLYTCEMDGKRLISDGHFAFILPDDAGIDVARARDKRDLSALWKKWETFDLLPPENPEACYGEDRTLSRRIGKVYVAERYFRCFEPAATWHVARPVNAQPVYVFLDGVVVGLVMPRRKDVPGIAVAELTDEQVFAPFACHENDWYLVSDKVLAERIEAAESERERAEEAIEEAEGRLEDANNELRSIRDLRRRKAMTAHNQGGGND